MFIRFDVVVLIVVILVVVLDGSIILGILFFFRFSFGILVLVGIGKGLFESVVGLVCFKIGLLIWDSFVFMLIMLIVLSLV